VIYRPHGGSTFVFAVLAALRAKQLVRGAVPRIAGQHKPSVTAQLEVLAGKVPYTNDGATPLGTQARSLVERTPARVGRTRDATG
jgi:DNA-directed RNA polymerase subunit K/omega